MVDLSRETFIDTYEHQNDPLHFWDYVESAFTEEKLQQELLSHEALFFLAYYDGGLAGYCKIHLNRQVSGLPVEGPHMELERIYVQKLYKGLGIGRALLDKAIETGQSCGQAYLWLGVWKKNAPSIRWYERQGFAQFGEQCFLMGADPQDDWLMYLKLPQL
ncbi:MAG: GNAT family N-acetyltransferase [Haliscomenobacter sp.]|nr:GNAT family N-acetyltransferase [Haliscomenobacter sp.]